MKKKVASMILFLVFCIVSAGAEEVTESPVLNMKISQIILQNMQMDPTEFIIQVVEVEEASDAIVKMYEQIQKAIEADEEITEMISKEIIEESIAAIPADDKPERMIVAEFIPLIVAGYEAEIGGVTIGLQIPGDYSNATVAAIIGVWNGEAMEWHSVEIIVEQGEMCINLSMELLEKMNSCENVLVILRDSEL